MFFNSSLHSTPKPNTPWLDGDLGVGEDGFFYDDIPNLSNMTHGPDGNNTSGGPEPMPMYARVLITVMYSTITLLSVGGNGIVCYIVLAYHKMRTVTNFFIVNLACADLLTAVLCIPFTFIANLLVQYWPFGAIMCPVINYAQLMVVFVSAFTLVAISLDRFVAVICPLRPKMTTRQAGAVIAVIWTLALAVPLPVAIMSRIFERADLYGVKRDFCDEDWGDSMHRAIYSMVIMVLQYFLPLFVLMFTYTWIGIIIWGKKIPGEAENARDQRMAASKRKMVKMMITVVIIYALCWLPLHIVTLVGDSYPEIWTFRYIQVVWIGSHWLAMSNCCYNPMVYCWMNARFRSGFKYVFRWCPCVDLDNNSSKQKVRQMHTFVQPADQNAAGHGGGVGAGVGGGLRVNKPRTNRNSPYTPPTRGGGGGGGGGGIYQGETYSSYYSNESIAMQPTCKMKNGSGERTVAKCRLAPDGPFTGNNNFNGYERLSLSNSSEMA